jgi:hypothetical protein
MAFKIKEGLRVGNVDVVNSSGTLLVPAPSWLTARTINLAGDLSGSVSIKGDSDVTLTATIVANSVALGVDTTGNYVATVSGTANQILVSGSGTETATVTLSLPQDIHTNASPTFADLTLTGNLKLPANAVIDPASYGDNTGTLTIKGNLQVDGTTTTINSTVQTVSDPVLTLGGEAAPTSDDNKDRGIEFKWHNGATAKLGFFGFDDSTGKFTFIPDATNTSEVFSGTKGTLDANLEWSDILNKPSTFTQYSIDNTDTEYTWATTGSTSPDSTSDGLTFVSGPGIELSMDSASDAIKVSGLGSANAYHSGLSTSVAATSTTAIDTFSLSTYRSAKYIVQITQGANYQVSEVLVIHNGTTTSMTEYGVLETNGGLATITSDVSAGNVRLLVTMASATAATIMIERTILAV